MHSADFRAMAGHIKRFVTESFGLGMLTAAVQSHYGWEPDERSLANFDVLPTRLAGTYSSTGVRPDLLFDFGDGDERWRLAGEARGRSEMRPKGKVISGAQRQRLDQIVAWSGRNDQHRVTMTWAYTGSDHVQVDLFRVQKHAGARPDAVFEAEVSRLPLAVIEEHAEDRAAALTDQLYESAPEPPDARPIFDSRVRGDWVTADLVAPSDLHLLLGVLDRPLPPQHIRTIRRGREASPQVRYQDPIQIAVMQRILIVVARGGTSPPGWTEIVDRLQ